MKAFNIVFGILLIASTGWVTLDITTNLPISETDYRAIELNTEKLSSLLKFSAKETSFKSYRHIFGQAFLCNDDNAFQVLDKAKETRKLTFNAYLASQKSMADFAKLAPSEGYSPSEAQVADLEKTIKGFVKSLNALLDEGTGEIKSPLPLKNRESGEEIALSSLSGEPKAIWEVATRLLQASVLESERITVFGTATRLNCGNVSLNPKVMLSPKSNAVGNGGTYEAEMFLGTYHFTPSIDVKTTNGSVVIGKDGKAILTIPADASSFDANGEAVISWNATVEVPDFFESRTFEIKKDFVVKQ